MSINKHYHELTPLEQLTVLANLTPATTPVFKTFTETLDPYHVVNIDELFLLTDVLNIIYDSGRRISRIEKVRNATDIDIHGDREFKLRIRRNRLTISHYNVFIPTNKNKLKRLLSAEKVD